MQDFYNRLNKFIEIQINEPALDNSLKEIRKKALEDNVPIIKDVTADFLRTILLIKKPKKILEFGTAVGYSSLFFNSLIPDSQITTIENYQIRYDEAKENIKKLNKEKSIKIINGDALEVAQNLLSDSEKFDFIFIDSAKAQYKNLFLVCENLINDGGLIIADNILQNGDILESHYTIQRRDRTIHKRLREFIQYVMGNKSFITSLIPIGDGLLLSFRSEINNE